MNITKHLSQVSSANPAGPELGTAQPQLVITILQELELRTYSGVEYVIQYKCEDRNAHILYLLP